MKPVWVEPKIVVPFVASLADIRPDFGDCRTVAVLDDEGNMVAGIVLHNWCQESGVIEVSAASIDRRWASRRVLNAVFDYCFGTAGCQMVVARHAQHNKSARRLWKALGASEYIIPRLRGRAASEAIATLTDDKWEKSKFKRFQNG